MKELKIAIVVVMLLIAITLGIRLFGGHKYTQKDVDKALDIYLNDSKPSKKELKLYDLDKNNEINLYDVVKINKKVK